MAIGNKVIKSDLPDSSPAPAARRSGVLNAEVFEATKEAERIIERAQKEAEAIKARALEEKAQIFNEARKAGRQEGIVQVTAELVKAKVQAGEILKQAQQDILQLALKIAEKIIGKDVERQPEILVSICATAVENVRNAKALTLRVNPKSAAVLRAKKADLIELVARSVDVAIKEDPEIEPLGCIIQTEFGTIDAQLGTQFEMLDQVLREKAKEKDKPKP